MAAIAYHMITNDKVDKDFLDKYAVGYEPFRKYILGEDDGVKKTTEWASKISAAKPRAAPSGRSTLKRRALGTTAISEGSTSSRPSSVIR